MSKQIPVIMKTNLIIILSFFLLHTQSFAQIELVSGMKRGSYNRFANDIAKITDVPINVVTSKGSLDNFEKLVNSPTPLTVFLQYDVLIMKKYLDRANKKKLTHNLRVLLPLASEEIHLICRKDDDIHKLADLRKKKVAIGSKGQGTHVTAKLIKGIRKVKWIDVPIGFDQAFTALMNKEVDAIFYVGYAPATKLYRFSAHEKIKLVPIKYRKLNSYYEKSVIPAGTYKWADYDVPTFAVKSVLVTKIGDETPENIKDNLKMLYDIKKKINKLQQKGHPKWKEVNFDYMKIKWQLYPGALKAVYPNK